MLYICNAFSLSMMPSWMGEDDEQTVKVTVISDPKEFLSKEQDIVVSAVGHADVAALFSEQLGANIEMNRVSVHMDDDTVLLVGQYSGPRLPEGTTQLPAGATIKWLLVEISH